MARFEVFIPAAEPGSFDVTLRVEAANWMQALKMGFHRLGEQGLVPHNVLVDVQDDGSVHVTDANSARVFRIREMSEAETAAAKVKPKPTPIGTPVPTEPVAPPPSPAMVDLVSRPSDRSRRWSAWPAGEGPAPDQRDGRATGGSSGR
jgi:hypothetical protein